jgi:hypothetical protein
VSFNASRENRRRRNAVVNGRVAVIYHSATGNVHALAQTVADGAMQAGAEVRRRHVEELASELLISQNQYWGRHRSIISDEPVATPETSSEPTASRSERRRASGNVAAQLKQFIDQAGRLWQEGKLADKARRRSPHRRSRTVGRSQQSSRSTRPSTTAGW